MNTREKIRDKALEMFNERGIEYVGLRELAAILEMRVSNITYYFPTKDDLVFDLAKELSRTNSAIFTEEPRTSLLDFLRMLQQVFINHIRFRCLLLSIVHIMNQNKLIQASYRKTQVERNKLIRYNLLQLVQLNYLKLDDEQTDNLGALLALTNRFWISEAAISNRHSSLEQQMKHYLEIITGLLKPYCTAKGSKDCRRFVEDLNRSSALSSQ